MGSEVSKPKAIRPNDVQTGSATSDERNPTLAVVTTKLQTLYSKSVPAKSEDELKELAKTLQDPKLIKGKYFGPILEIIEDCKAEAAGDAKDYRVTQFRNRAEKQHAIERVDYGMQRVQDIHVKLLWFEIQPLQNRPLAQQVVLAVVPLLRGKEFVYGPFHVALQVGDIVVEWNNSSLIIPHRIDPTHHPLMSKRIGEQPPATPVPDDMQTFRDTVNEVLITADNKTYLIDQLCELIASYNKKQTYGIFTNNCQHFAADALSALGHEKEAADFRGKSEALANAVMKGGAKEDISNQLEFNTHEELNNHVTTNDGLSFEDLELCQLHYLLFHVWSTKCPEKDEWRCIESECKLGLVQDRLRRNKPVVHAQ